MGQAIGDMGENFSRGAEEWVADSDFTQGVQEKVQEVHGQVFPNGPRWLDHREEEFRDL